ncbi:amino acid adenylation domain-containing protein [Andreprevotia lacus DSM 23236]|jgi:amino acid adenylation domain-containing protein|uniref:Amino acid adenylation domain-containing protein n=1 Tax=Andreprevotia lacus DSM 23236 TaxID=1121001 RepID=A0A1W1XAR8_9NEIS|nr:amino acid adenylation domain-containing protein [Andreprevotia lacus]SMC20947.1 amino acid adenylation domain-containing protein [Andreprevotia lacus DSM 23236]
MTHDVDVLFAPPQDQDRKPPAPAWPQPLCLHRAFEARAAQAPQAVALRLGAATLSYGELNARANRLARHLRTLGVGPDVLVALCAARSFELLVGMLAILKAGGAYVPLDPAYPSERLQTILADSAPAVLLHDDDGQAALAGQALALPGVHLQHDAGLWAMQAAHPLSVEECSVGPQHLAYVIYTSGSTGQPKGVMVEHRQVLRLFASTQHWFGFGPRDVWALCHSCAFDFSVWEIWGALRYGGELLIVPLDVVRSPRDCYALLCQAGVTVLNQTPSAFALLSDAQADQPQPHRLRWVIFGGEALTPHRLKPWYARSLNTATTLINMYGITETTVHVTWRRLSPADTEANVSPIGERIPDLRLYVLDQHRRPVPDHVEGELYVGGAGVARGYLHRPELTAERFLDSPFVAGDRLYKTGDLVRRQADGSLIYCGRNDFQVKIRGFRIELGEIETALARAAGVAEAVVLAREDVPGDLRLVAYYRGDAQPDALRAHATQALPAYMVPAAYVQLAALPLTPNGKLDRKALPAPDDAACARSAYVAPLGEAETQLAQLWAEVLGLQQVGRFDDFFLLGGHSLLAVTLMARIKAESGVDVPLLAIFQHTTLHAFAVEVARLWHGAQQGSDHLVPVRPGSHAVQLFFVHEGSGTVAYAMDIARHLPPGLPVQALLPLGTFAGETPLYSVPDMACRYVAQIRAAQPAGPYQLAGWCGGGPIAYEMAQQLHAAGQTVSLLAMIDVILPDPEPAASAPPTGPETAARIATLERELALDFILAELPGLPADEVSALAALPDLDTLLAQFLALKSGTAALGEEIDRYRRMVAVYAAISHARQVYRPSPSRVPVQLLATRSSLRECPQPDLGWHALAEGQLTTTILPGDHFSIIQPPHVRQLALVLLQARAAGLARYRQ